MPVRRPILGGTFALLLASIVASARADEPPSLTWSQEALEGVEEDPESPELRLLRLAEEELFRGREAKAAREATLDAPAAADEPPAEFERNGEKVSLAFLRGLELPSIPVRWDRHVLEYLCFFKHDPRGRELASAWLKRSERYGPMIRQTLHDHGLPADLQYVAMIESGYDPRARSNVDALGMWQFVEQPASFYGLKIDHWIDERLDTEHSTRAAARFLRDLHERFGSWELAFAAYNMGYGGLLRSIRKYNTNDYSKLAQLEAGLPFETTLYVAKITAMAIVAHNPRAFGFGDVGREAPLALGKIDVPAGTALRDVAEAAGLSVEQLKAVNPQLKRMRVPPGDTTRLFVPKGAELRFAQNFKADSARFASHVLRHGETLEELAKRIGVSAEKLRELNELAEDARPLAGFALFVPSGTRPTADLVEPLIAAVPDREFHYEGRERLFYRVAPGDTLSALARLFEVTEEELASWNHLSDRAALQSGMLLQLFVVPELDLSRAVVYRADEVRILTVGSDAFFEHYETQRGRVRVRYRVQPNDTLNALASRYDLSVGSIARINQFPSQRELVADEWLTLYVPEAELAKLEAGGVAERIGTAVAARDALDTKDASADELPESEGEPLLKPRPEGPMTPPKKTRTLSAAASTSAPLGARRGPVVEQPEEKPRKAAPRGK